ncbi:MAG: hypothetical protein ACOYZ6_14955 [Chloroflexota bacterium]
MAQSPPEYPRVPPFIYGDEAPDPTNSEKKTPVHEGSGSLTPQSLMNLVMLFVSLATLTLALICGAWLGYGILKGGFSNWPPVIVGGLVTALIYLAGWTLTLVGIRGLKIFILPFLVQLYAWITLGGIVYLQVTIISKLYRQEYDFGKFALYVFVFGAAMIALVGLHLLVEKHKLAPLAFPILGVCLAHLFLIGLRYVLSSNGQVKYEYVFGDLGFLAIAVAVGLLMLAHLGIFSGVRNLIDRIFSQTANHFGEQE